MYHTTKNYTQNHKIPPLFSNLARAGESLVSDWHVASYSVGNIWYPTTEKLPAAPPAGTWQMKSMSILARWSSAYDVYLNIRGDSLTKTKRKGAAALGILKELGSTAMMLTRTTVDDQMSWDVFCPMFQKIVSLADDIIELELNSTEERPAFCIDMALVGPLFEVSLLSKICPLFKNLPS
jgi:hypothetical protein